MDHTYRIVVGVDGSAGGQLTLRWALAEATGHGGTVQAVIAWQWDGSAMPPTACSGPDAAKDRATQILSRELAAALAVTPHPLPPVASEVVRGSASDTLTRAAHDADVLALGSHGHGRLRHAVLGSVSENCVRHATCPVVVIPVPAPDRHHTDTAATR